VRTESQGRTGKNGKQLSILHIHTLPVVSGSGINTLLTMMGSAERGHRVTLACESRGRLTEDAERAGIGIRLIPAMGRNVHVLKDLTALLALAREIRAGNYDIVHTHNSKAGFLGRLAGRLAAAPLVIHTVHGFAFHDSEPPVRQATFRFLERAAGRWCDGLIFISKALENWANREGIGDTVPRAVIYSGIDVKAFQGGDRGKVRRELGIADGRLVVGMISKLWEGKGHDVLFQAWKNVLTEWTLETKPLLLIVGEGPLEFTLRNRVLALNISSHVKFAGFRSDISDITAAVDVAVLPSAFEGMGRVVLEAMAAGKPVVASRVGGIPDLVQDGITGYLVNPGDYESLGRKLMMLLQDNRLRTDLGTAARAAILPEHTAEHMIGEIHRFYDRITANRSSR
jgi:glycosyltransferase involved in cell wall biosynthesis